MKPALGEADVARFRGLLARDLGWSFDDARTDQLAELLARRAAALGLAAPAYLDQLARSPSRGEQGHLARELTVPETYFFRHAEQLRAFVEVALPARLAIAASRAADRRVRVLSAGCASGEEPYSLAILAHEAGLDARRDLAIRAVDVSPAALEKAARARYTPWALRETPADVRGRWFSAADPGFALDPRIQSAVTFEEANLVADDRGVLAPAAYDVVFCRNVLMYFTPESAAAVVALLERAIAPGGFLFLGHAETLRGLSQGFHLRYTHEAFYYERHGASERPAPPRELSRAEPPREAGAPADSTWAATWIETVRRTSARIHSLTEPSAAAPSAVAGHAPRDRVDAAMALLEAERFDEALAHLGDLARSDAGDPGALLLRAVLLTHRGDVAAAEAACAELLAIDELNAGAHYVLALCRESASDRPGAIAQDRIAAYLDPTFAMPRLHLGLLARKAGDREGASRELSRATALLPREDPSRLLLFGGGFTRDGLIALCRSELAKLEATS